MAQDRGPWPVDPRRTLWHSFLFAWKLVLSGHKARRISDDTILITKGMPDAD